MLGDQGHTADIVAGGVPGEEIGVRGTRGLDHIKPSDRKIRLDMKGDAAGHEVYLMNVSMPASA